MSLNMMLDSGEVRRYHAHPQLARFGQTDADHQWRCLILILMLHPNPSSNLMIAAATHDCGELGAGDLPFSFKREHPALAERHKEIEQKMAREMGQPLFVLNHRETLWLNMVDRLESALYAKKMLGSLPRNWEQNNKEVLRDASLLGIHEQVEGILNA